MLVSFFISIIGLLFLFLNSVLFVVSRKGKNKVYQYVTLYLLVQFIIELSCNVIGILKPNENFFISHYAFVIQFVLLSLFFKQVFKNAFLKKLVLLNSIVVLLILSFQYYRNPNLYWSFNYFEIGITSILLVLYAVVYFYENLKETYNYFYFCLGLVFYLTSSCLIFLTGNTELVFFTEPFYFDIWIFNSIFFILYQALIYQEWRNLRMKVMS